MSRPAGMRFQDEARVGQKGVTPRLWTRRVRDYRDGGRRLFGAARGTRGNAAAPVSDRADTAETNAHPEAIGAPVAPGSAGVVALDLGVRSRSWKTGPHSPVAARLAYEQPGRRAGLSWPPEPSKRPCPGPRPER